MVQACRDRACGALIDAVDEAVELAPDHPEGCLGLRRVGTALLQSRHVCRDPGKGDQKVSRQGSFGCDTLARKEACCRGGSSAVQRR